MKNKNIRKRDGFTDNEIQEMLNNPKSIEEIVPDFNFQKINTHKYQFIIKNLIYNVDITESIIQSSGKKIIEIKFKLMNNPNAPKKSNFPNDRQYQIALQKSQIGITGTGSPQKIFGKVFGAIIDVIKEIDPDYITFTADEAKRQRLYLKFLDLFQKYIPQKYEQTKINPLTDDETGSEEFWLIKK
jgi:hypothetical protein